MIGHMVALVNEGLVYIRHGRVILSIVVFSISFFVLFKSTPMVVFGSLDPAL